MRVLGHMRPYASCQPSGCWVAGSLTAIIIMPVIYLALRVGCDLAPATRQPNASHPTRTGQPWHWQPCPHLVGLNMTFGIPTYPQNPLPSRLARSLARSTISSPQLQAEVTRDGWITATCETKQNASQGPSASHECHASDAAASAWWSRCNAHVADCLHPRQAMLSSR